MVSNRRTPSLSVAVGTGLAVMLNFYLMFIQLLLQLAGSMIEFVNKHAPAAGLSLTFLLLCCVVPSRQVDQTGYWTTSQLSLKRAYLSSASALDLAIFAGGGSKSHGNCLFFFSCRMIGACLIVIIRLPDIVLEPCSGFVGV